MSNNYWAERIANAQTAITSKSIKATERQLARYYERAMRKTIREFEATYDKLLATIGEGRTPTPADLYKLDRYWELQAQCRNELQRLGYNQIALFSDSFESQYFDIYNSISIPGGQAFNTISTENVRQMTESIWCADGKSWSQRIWENTDYLLETLNEGLIECVATGKKPSELKQRLQERFNVSYNQADTIVRTESAHIQTEAAKKRYQDYGIQMVEVLADKDERRCEVCGKLHQKRYPVGAQMPVPAHPRCRCCIIPVIE